MNKATKAFIENMDPVLAYALGKGTYDEDSRGYLVSKGFLESGKGYNPLTDEANFLDAVLNGKMVADTFSEPVVSDDERVLNALKQRAESDKL